MINVRITPLRIIHNLLLIIPVFKNTLLKTPRTDQNLVRMAILTLHKMPEEPQHPLVADTTRSRQALRPQIQHPGIERHLAKPLIQHSRSRHHHGRKLLHKHPVIPMAESVKQHPHPRHHQIAEIVQHQRHLSVPARHNRQPRHLQHAPVMVMVIVKKRLPALFKEPIPLKELPLRVVRHPAHHVHLVSLLSPVERDVITPEHLGIKILTNKKYLHSLLLSFSLTLTLSLWLWLSLITYS